VITRYYFYSVTGTVAPRLSSTSSGSDAIYKLSVAHLWLVGHVYSLVPIALAGHRLARQIIV